MGTLEYPEISAEVRGCMAAGKLKMTEQDIIFKSEKTGKIESIPVKDLEAVNFQTFAGSVGIRLFLKNGTLHRFAGFQDSERDRLAEFFKTVYKMDMLEKELSLKGCNWGAAKINGGVLSFDVERKSVFEIPLSYVSQCTSGKNEIALEFHQNEDAPVSLMELKLHIPSNEPNGETVETIQEQVLEKASIISVSGDAIVIFREIHCLAPRGRYDIKIFQNFVQLHGKTFDFKIPMSEIIRLFLLPHKDQRQMFFVVTLDPPIKQGQTRYHHLVFLLGQDEETSVELPFTVEEVEQRYEGKLEKNMSGPTYEVLGRVMKVIIGRKLIGPGGFLGHYGSPAISCSLKAAVGYLYPLERGFMYVHKPPIHIRFEEIESVNFARGGGNTRTFDFEIALKLGTLYTFSSIQREEYTKLFDYATAKKLNVKNLGKNPKSTGNEDYGFSDNEEEPDAYLQNVRAEAERRGDEGSEDESTDEDFQPPQEQSDVAEEFDSSPSSTAESDDDDEAGTSEGETRSKKKKEPIRERQKTKTVSERPRQKRTKKDKDDNRPKRPTTAFMLWLNETRNQIKSENPGLKVTEIAKKGGEMWRALKDKSEWEKKAAEAKERYRKAMEKYGASGGGKSEHKEKKPVEKQTKTKSSGMQSVPTSQIKSREFVEEDDTSSEEEDERIKNKKVQKGKNKETESESEESKSGTEKSESNSENSKCESRKSLASSEADSDS